VRTELYDLKADVGESRDVAAEHPDVVARMDVILSREHAPSPLSPLAAPAPAYVARRTASGPETLLQGGAVAWIAADRIAWGPESIGTNFRAVWSDQGLFVRYDVTDPSPWYTLTRRDDRLWTEEVVELFLDVGATGRSYAEVEWNPANAVVDLWVDRAESRFDKAWDWSGLESRVKSRTGASGRATGWTVTSFLPWAALEAKAPAGTALPPKVGDRWRFNVFRIERHGGPSAPENDVQLLAWSPTGERSFHVPRAFREIVFSSSPPPHRGRRGVPE
jgi:hypothetical protein